MGRLKSGGGCLQIGGGEERGINGNNRPKWGSGSGKSTRSVSSPFLDTEIEIEIKTETKIERSI